MYTKGIKAKRRRALQTHREAQEKMSFLMKKEAC